MHGHVCMGAVVLVNEYVSACAHLCFFTVQVAEKLKETRKYFALYNTLDDTRTYISREVSLLDSIQKGYTPSMASPAGKQQLLSQFKTILEGVDKTVEKVCEYLALEHVVSGIVFAFVSASVSVSVLVSVSRGLNADSLSRSR